MTQTLEQLSVAATEAQRLLPEFYLSPFYKTEYAIPCDKVKAAIEFTLTRTGQLVAVSDDAVERVARALCEASGEAWRSGEGLRYPFSQNAKQLNNHWLYKAKAALSALVNKP